MVTNQVAAGRRHERREAAQELARFEEQRLAAVGERALQAKRQAAVGQRGEPFLRERWTRAVAAQVREAHAVVGVQMHAGVE